MYLKKKPIKYKELMFAKTAPLLWHINHYERTKGKSENASTNLWLRLVIHFEYTTYTLPSAVSIKSHLILFLASKIAITNVLVGLWLIVDPLTKWLVWMLHIKKNWMNFNHRIFHLIFSPVLFNQHKKTRSNYTFNTINNVVSKDWNF